MITEQVRIIALITLVVSIVLVNHAAEYALASNTPDRETRKGASYLFLATIKQRIAALSGSSRHPCIMAPW